MSLVPISVEGSLVPLALRFRPDLLIFIRLEIQAMTHPPCKYRDCYIVLVSRQPTFRCGNMAEWSKALELGFRILHPVFRGEGSNPSVVSHVMFL